RLIVQKGAILTITQGSKLIIEDTTNTSLTVSGTVVNSGDLEIAGKAVFGANAVYKHQQAGGRLPVKATWDPGSIIEFNHKGEIKPEPFKSSVVFGRMIIRKNASVILDGEAGTSSKKITFANGADADIVIEDEATLKLGSGVDSFILSNGVSAEINGTL